MIPKMMNDAVRPAPVPVSAYGDEIGAAGTTSISATSAVRTPMQWDSDRNAGFSRANPQRLFLPVVIDPGYHSQAVNVEAQDQEPELRCCGG